MSISSKIKSFTFCVVVVIVVVDEMSLVVPSPPMFSPRSLLRMLLPPGRAAPLFDCEDGDWDLHQTSLLTPCAPNLEPRLPSTGKGDFNLMPTSLNCIIF